jgi:hypothetical protein
MKNAVFWDVTPCGSCSLLILVTLMMDALCSSETLVLTEPHGITSQKAAFFIAKIIFKLLNK